MRKQIKLNEYEFCAEEFGIGKNVVFIHGSASDFRTWSNCAKKLSNKFRTILYSRRFHWPNEKVSSGQDYSMMQHVEDLKCLIKHYTDEPINLVGHSYGALMCLEMACQNPEMVDKMVLIEPPSIRLFVSNTPKPKEIISLLFKRPKTALSIIKLGAQGLGPATKAAEKGEMNKVLELFGKAVLGKETYGKLTVERKKIVLENLIASEFTGSGFLPLIDDKLKKVQMPILLMTGEKSPKVFTYLKNRLDELLPNSLHIQVSNASHIIHEDNEKEFIYALNSFFN